MINISLLFNQTKQTLQTNMKVFHFIKPVLFSPDAQDGHFSFQPCCYQPLPRIPGAKWSPFDIVDKVKTHGSVIKAIALLFFILPGDLEDPLKDGGP